MNDDFLELAITQALKSPMRHKHGAVLFKRKKVIGTGYNWPVAPPNSQKKRFSIHSERDACKGLRFDQIMNADMLVIRVVGNDNLLRMSKPCTGCMKLLSRHKVRSVFWHDSSGRINRTYL